MTNAQKVFCDEYLIDFNATRAYKVAYKSCKKDETARVNGSKLLTITNIKNYIDEQMKERQKRTEITQDRVLEELAAIAFTNATEFAETERNGVVIKDTSELDENTKKAIISIVDGKDGVKIKTANKLQALELLGKHLGMFKDKTENLNVSINYEDYLKEVADKDEY